MVPLTERDSFMKEAHEDPELGPLRAFLFREPVTSGISGDTRARLFDAIHRNDTGAFQAGVEDLSRRTIVAGSEWIGDDFVVFLLLIGARKFKFGKALIDKLLDCRRSMVNPSTQRLNEVFDAIHRGEFAMEGEYAFVKCVFRDLTEQWAPSEVDSSKLYQRLITPGCLHDLNPFLQLVALRAFDLVLIHRAPRDPAFQNWEDIITQLQEDGTKLSLRQLGRLIKHLRFSVVIMLVVSLLGIIAAAPSWLWWKGQPVREVNPLASPNLDSSTAGFLVTDEQFSFAGDNRIQFFVKTDSAMAASLFFRQSDPGPRPTSWSIVPETYFGDTGLLARVKFDQDPQKGRAFEFLITQPHMKLQLPVRKYIK